jgi:hypothetical protein
MFVVQFRGYIQQRCDVGALSISRCSRGCFDRVCCVLVYHDSKYPMMAIDGYLVCVHDHQ